MQRADDAEFAIDRMRRGQQLARRLAAQHVSAARRLQQISRVRLAAFELLHAERTGEALHLRRQKFLETRGIKPQRGRRLLGAGKSLLAVEGGHFVSQSFRGAAEGREPGIQKNFGW